MVARGRHLKIAADGSADVMTASVGGDLFDPATAASIAMMTHALDAVDKALSGRSVRRCVRCNQLASFASECCNVNGLVGPHSFHTEPL